MGCCAQSSNFQKALITHIEGIVLFKKFLELSEKLIAIQINGWSLYYTTIFSFWSFILKVGAKTQH
jgi:hypothetical protein